jgi:hypothetical protein
LSAISATTPKSWVMKSTAVPFCGAGCRSAAELGLGRHVSAVVGSSAMRSLGSSASAMAIITRWRWPPDSSCG